MILLHPRYRLRYFENKWKGPLKKYFGPMKKAVEQLYNDKYRREPAEEDKGVSQPKKSFLTSYLDDAVPDTIKDK
jgi:hypothetical protein